MFANEEGGPEPDWVITEREQFSDFRDLNKDGKMDKDEIQHWILPQDYDHALAEARHLVYESDVDKVCSVPVSFLKKLYNLRVFLNTSLQEFIHNNFSLEARIASGLMFPCQFQLVVLELQSSKIEFISSRSSPAFIRWDEKLSSLNTAQILFLFEWSWLSYI